MFVIIPEVFVNASNMLIGHGLPRDTSAVTMGWASNPASYEREIALQCLSWTTQVSISESVLQSPLALSLVIDASENWTANNQEAIRSRNLSSIEICARAQIVFKREEEFPANSPASRLGWELQAIGC
ncbi:hypothetical protein CIHG_08215 [Coccidioides immitis H538.4]|uniref:Uncharacterized protein n=2 Tax=Coccidioides immitis TaxID=5501 RepID=A0A0J8RZ04_COCIT|nr:hypothetical protein CIRG_04280 [Coccidioides immitis RMSCC 2394]KMU90405.1 hypothetical protein CIHG_08215 [Coccidioides immitis H538.4]